MACRQVLPKVPQVAVFDTAFHQTMPAVAYMYALPAVLYTRHRVRRYRFHGTSHLYVHDRAVARLRARGRTDLKVITAHLGNGCSAAAIQGGRSLDTSMGMTPLEGLVMGTRCGDLDPQVVLHVTEVEELSPAQISTMMNKHSGLSGLSGISSDMRELLKAASGGEQRARLAIDVFCYRLRKYIGAYAAALGGPTASDATMRELEAQGLPTPYIVEPPMGHDGGARDGSRLESPLHSSYPPEDHPPAEQPARPSGSGYRSRPTPPGKAGDENREKFQNGPRRSCGR